MFADSPGGGAQAKEIAKLEGEKQQLASQLDTVDNRVQELDTLEQELDKEAAELEEKIRTLAKEEASLLQRKKELKENARQIGNRRSEILGQRKKLQREQSSLQSTATGLDGKINKIQQQMAYEETQKSAAIQLEEKPEPKNQPGNQPDQKRTHPRVAVEVEVSMHTEHNFYTGLTENLSEGGLFVATYENLSIGTLVALTIRLPDHEPFKAQGQVRWVREHSEFTSDVSPGVGVEFTELQTNDQALIEQFIQTRTPLFYETV